MAHCIVCKKELNDSEIKICEMSGTYGLYCNFHLQKLYEKKKEKENEHSRSNNTIAKRH